MAFQLFECGDCGHPVVKTTPIDRTTRSHVHYCLINGMKYFTVRCRYARCNCENPHARKKPLSKKAIEEARKAGLI